MKERNDVVRDLKRKKKLVVEQLRKENDEPLLERCLLPEEDPQGITKDQVFLPPVWANRAPYLYVLSPECPWNWEHVLRLKLVQFGD